MIAAIFALLSACAPAETCSSKAVGECESVETCCTAEACRFVVDDEVFECDAYDDCTAASVEVAEYCTDP